MRLDEALAECPVVAILRGVGPDEVVEHAAALLAGGVRAVEVPLNSPDPLDSVARLAQAFNRRMAVGAGTVTSVEAVDAVARAGGTFIVAPNTDPDIIVRAGALGLDAAPGFATATEAFAAIAAGARHLKLFPASSYGSSHLKQLRAVLPNDVIVWAVGGVSPASMLDWLAAGAQVFGVGGELYRPGQAASITRARAEEIHAVLS